MMGPIAFKTLIVKHENGITITSPSHQAEWSDLGLLDAKCSICKEIPGHKCTCGIYTTLDMFYARSYANALGSILFLIEGTGHIEMYTEGFRSEQGFVIAVVNDGIDPLAQRFAADLFQVEIITPDVALEAVKEQWKLFGMDWPYREDYDQKVQGVLYAMS